jgi:hypothetical protein
MSSMPAMAALTCSSSMSKQSGRSGKAYSDWISQRSSEFRDGIEWVGDDVLRRDVRNVFVRPNFGVLDCCAEPLGRRGRAAERLLGLLLLGQQSLCLSAHGARIGAHLGLREGHFDPHAIS